jgi:hypothetical protein
MKRAENQNIISRMKENARMDIFIYALTGHRCKTINDRSYMRTREFLSGVMTLAWQFVKRNGFTLSQALKVAWANMKLKLAMTIRIVKFYFQKVDGTKREAYGTLNNSLVPAIVGGDTRKKNDTVQTYFDTERQEWRCFKKANLLSIG